MVRVMGAVLVAGAGGWLGFGAAAGLRARAEALEELGEGLGLMAQELELDAPALEELMERLVPRSRGAARRLFSGCLEALGRLEEEPFSGAWRRLVGEELLLDGEGQACLTALGEVLGRCGWEEQRRALEITAARLGRMAARERERGLRMARVYQTLGLSGGLLLAVLLL